MKKHLLLLVATWDTHDSLGVHPCARRLQGRPTAG